MTVNDTKAIKAHFQDNLRYGRTTQLVEKATGRVLFEGMGVHTRRALWKTYRNLSSCAKVIHIGDESYSRN